MNVLPLPKITLVTCLLFSCLPSMAARPQYSIAAGKDDVCKLAQDYLNSNRSSLPAAMTLLAQPQTPASSKLPGDAQGEQLVNFDFDNDGVPDQVFSHDGASNYLMGTVLYVQHGKAGTALKSAPLVADLAIYPCQFDASVKKSASCPPLAQDADEAGITFDVPGGKSVFFRGRYTEMTPVRYLDKTWLVLVSASADTRKYAALIQPEAGKRYRPACLFKNK